MSKIGRELYEKFFRNYTRNQWGLDPSELDATVTARVPTRTNRDDRYFTDKYQSMPLHGCTRMFEKMPVYQPAAVVNYPNDYAYTRATEFKYLTGQEHSKTSVVYEFPRENGDPYYPVPHNGVKVVVADAAGG